MIGILIRNPSMLISRRPFLQRAALLLGAAALPPSAWANTANPSAATATPTAPSARLAAAWRARSAGAEAAATTDYVGVLQLDWGAGQVRIAQATPVQGRAHGLLAEAGGGFLAIASRPGQWLMRLDAQGKLVQQHRLDQETPARTFDGHIMTSDNGQWLYTTETDRSTGQGWVSVRDARTLAKVAQWATQGMDPHQVVRDAQGMLVVANGGIPRTAKGEKRDLHLMAPSLVRLNPANGELLGQWRLADPRLSIRHLAWSTGEQPLLGVALQAEHDDVDQRRAAPALALWDSKELRIPTRAATAGGYAGDIAPGPGGGFVLSGQRVGRGVLWHPDAPDSLMTIAELREVCALSPLPLTDQPSGVLLGAARGVALWHPRLAPAMLAWPQEMSPDNHWIALG